MRINESAYILGSSAEKFRDDIWGSCIWDRGDISLLFSLRLPKELAGLEFLSFVVGRGIMNAFLLTVERHNNTSASVSLKIPKLVGPAYRIPAVHLPRPQANNFYKRRRTPKL